MSIESAISLANGVFSRDALKVNYFSCLSIIYQNLRTKKGTVNLCPTLYIISVKQKSKIVQNLILWDVIATKMELLHSRVRAS